MQREELINDMKDILARIEGTINVLRKPDPIRADRKLQGLRDKARSMLYKIANESRGDAESLVKKLQEVKD